MTTERTNGQDATVSSRYSSRLSPREHSALRHDATFLLHLRLISLVVRLSECRVQGKYHAAPRFRSFNASGPRIARSRRRLCLVLPDKEGPDRVRRRSL